MFKLRFISYTLGSAIFFIKQVLSNIKTEEEKNIGNLITISVSWLICYFVNWAAKLNAIMSHGLYVFYPIFHCGLYCRVVSITNKLCTKQANSLIFATKIRVHNKQRSNIIFSKFDGNFNRLQLFQPIKTSTPVRQDFL